MRGSGVPNATIRRSVVGFFVFVALAVTVWPAVAQAFDLNQVLVVDESGMVYLTAEMEQRVQFSGDVRRELIELNLD